MKNKLFFFGIFVVQSLFCGEANIVYTISVLDKANSKSVTTHSVADTEMVTDEVNRRNKNGEKYLGDLLYSIKNQSTPLDESYFRRPLLDNIKARLSGLYQKGILKKGYFFLYCPDQVSHYFDPYYFWKKFIMTEEERAKNTQKMATGRALTENERIQQFRYKPFPRTIQNLPANIKKIEIDVILIIGVFSDANMYNVNPKIIQDYTWTKLLEKTVEIVFSNTFPNNPLPSIDSSWSVDKTTSTLNEWLRKAQVNGWLKKVQGIKSCGNILKKYWMHIGAGLLLLGGITYWLRSKK
jgi:hypothetical protein